jgi:hypothetical protein
MKIAFILPSLRKGGPQSVVLALVHELISKRIEVKVFYFDDIIGTDFPCETERIGFWCYRKLKKYTIIHTHGIRPDFFIFLFKNFLNSKTITTLHSYIKEEFISEKNIFYANFFSILWKLLLSRHDGVILLSEHMLNHYKNILNKNKFYCYNSSILNTKKANEVIPTEEFDILTSIKKKYTVLGNISYIIQRKGLTQIIDLLAINESYFAIFIGDGYYKEKLINYASIKNVKERCLFLGLKINPHKYIKFFDVYVMPSYSEGFPMAILEVGQLNKPIVCSNLKIYNELFDNTEILTFKLNDTLDFDCKIKNALSNCDNLIANCKRKIEKKYLPINAANTHLEIYKKILNGK